MIEEISRVGLIKAYESSFGFLIELICSVKSMSDPNSAESKRLGKLAYSTLEDMAAIMLEAYTEDLGIGDYDDEQLEEGEPVLGEEGTSLAIPDMETLDQDFNEDLAAFREEGVDPYELLDADDD
jgi:hypothetical protein